MRSLLNVFIAGRRLSNMAGSYKEVERVFTYGLDWKIGRNLNAFNDILRGGLGRHEYGQAIHIQWLAYEKSVRDLGKEAMDTNVEIILNTENSGHDYTLERLKSNKKGGITMEGLELRGASSGCPPCGGRGAGVSPAPWGRLVAAVAGCLLLSGAAAHR